MNMLMRSPLVRGFDKYEMATPFAVHITTEQVPTQTAKQQRNLKIIKIAIKNDINDNE
jgi:hypothetical protein